MSITWTVLTGAIGTDGSIKQWMSNDDIPSTLILLQGEQYIYSKLRVRDMLTLATGTIAANAETVALPERYRAPRSLWISGVNKAQIEHKTLEDVEAERSYDADGNLVTGMPKMYFADKDNLRFNCKAVEAYPYRFWHYAALAPLSASDPTNFLTDRYPDLLYAACMQRAHLWDDNEEQAGQWAGAVDKLVMMANREADEEMGRGLVADIVVA